MRADGHSTTAIAAALNAENVPTPTAARPVGWWPGPAAGTLRPWRSSAATPTFSAPHRPLTAARGIPGRWEHASDPEVAPHARRRNIEQLDEQLTHFEEQFGFQHELLPNVAVIRVDRAAT